MAKSKKRVRRRDALPKNFRSLDEFWGFWDTHSTADYEQFMEETDLQINLRSSRIYCALAKDMIADLRNHARRQGVSTETLINLWLGEKLKEAARA